MSTKGPKKTGCPCAGRKCNAPLTLYTKLNSEWVKDLILRPNSIKSSLVVQWLRVNTPSAEGLGLTPGQGTKILHAGEQISPHATTRGHALQQKILHDAMKSSHPQLRPNNQINSF